MTFFENPGAPFFGLSVFLVLIVIGHIFNAFISRKKLLAEKAILEEILPKLRGKGKDNVQARLDEIQGLL